MVTFQIDYAGETKYVQENQLDWHCGWRVNVVFYPMPVPGVLPHWM